MADSNDVSTPSPASHSPIPSSPSALEATSTVLPNAYIPKESDPSSTAAHPSFDSATGNAGDGPHESSYTLQGKSLDLRLLGLSEADVNELISRRHNDHRDDDIEIESAPHDQPYPPFDDSEQQQRPRERKPTLWSYYKEHGFFPTLKWYAVKFFKENWTVLLFVFICALALMFLGIFAFEPLSWQAWMAFAITVAMLGFLIKGKIATQIVMLAAATGMLAFFIVTPQQALVGFSNTGVASVAALFAFSEGIERTSLLRPVFRFLLGRPTKLWMALIRLLVPIAIFSAFFHNTPIVAMLIPIVMKWSRQAGFPASKLLMPMNDATILGGTISLLGTSTNLIVVGLADNADLTDKDGNPLSFPIFGMAPAGIPVCVAGIIYLLIASNFLLKDRKSGGAEDLVKNPRQYTIALTVMERSPIVGDSIQGAGLRNLEGLFLVELTRSDGTSFPAPSHEVIIQAGDILLFAGVVETVTELYHIPGLVPATAQSDKINLERHRRHLVEVVISRSSDMVGYTVKETKFRTRFGAAIIAVHRHGEHVTQKIGDITLRAGDVLLIECGADFVEQFGKNHTFALVSEVNNSTPPREDLLHMLIAASATAVLIAITTAELMDILTVTLLCTFAMALTGCMTLAQAGAAVSIPVLLTIACSFGVSAGLQYSGAAGALAGFIVDVFSFAEIGLLFGIYIGTALLSAVITNNAAVALMFPIVAGSPDGIIYTENVNAYAALYTMMFAASSSFSTPIGYQTNLMVHGPGGYTFLDW
eukprot:CAMPEP_0184700370 /NCGR_PEP_ID=MMETSP0313-20130426/12602_1 /TAXON_ID=2792 /ORGANISM="Porphyridium aerugineum, Strain SAG 1380-2" /LENGTH=760 /DNA_ID=CAMNT_0027160001 /DNA_START=35 /DNA_END=2314 /DNA_ORIENTATION=-